MPSSCYPMQDNGQETSERELFIFSYFFFFLLKALGSLRYSPALNSSESRTDGESDYFEPGVEASILLEGYVGVEAKVRYCARLNMVFAWIFLDPFHYLDFFLFQEPNLSAQPEKPVLKKPGQPPRLRVRKRVSESKGDIWTMR